MQLKRRFFILIVFFPALLFAQKGKLVLIGGGTEYREAWSDMPYRWAVDQSENKKVAIIGYDLGNDPEWIPEYFKDLGALEAKNFLVDSRQKADDEVLANEISGFDVLFFKGGDQSRYYEYYNDSKLEGAIKAVYERGGVLAGTSAGAAILSGISFTAEKGSAYPEEVIENINHPRIVLRNDFLDFLPGFIADTHFIERGRLGRLMAFLANWQANTGEQVPGIGVDDQTALCVDADGIATAYGSGAVLILNKGKFYNDIQKLVFDSLNATQLLHGESYNLNTQTKVNPADGWSPAPDQETGNFTLLMSGDDQIGNNQQLIVDITSAGGGPSDSLLLVSRPNSALALSFKTALIQAGNTGLVHLEIKSQNNHPDSARLRNQIRNTKKILYVHNQHPELLTFLQSGPTGALLQKHTGRNRQTIALVGEDAAISGKAFIVNHLTNDLAAYRGQLDYQPGLQLLKTSMVMPDTYNARQSDFYENKIAGVLYGMGQDSLKYGIYLNPGSYLKFGKSEGQNYFQAGGTSPVIIAVHESGGFHLNRRTNRNNYFRSVAGFEKIDFFSLDQQNPLPAGTPIAVEEEPYQYEREPQLTNLPGEQGLNPQIWPNPSNGMIQVEWQKNNYRVDICDLQGRSLFDSEIEGSGRLNLERLAKGTYFIKIRNHHIFHSLKLQLR